MDNPIQSARGGMVVITHTPIGDFVRSHTLIQLLKARRPETSIDLVANHHVVGLTALMPEIRQGIGNRLRSGRLDLRARVALARKLKLNGYRTAVVVSRSWKAALVPMLAGIPERIGWFGELRYPLINRPRFGDRRLERFVDRIGMLGLAPGEPAPSNWPAPRFVIPPAIYRDWLERAEEAKDGRPILVLAPSAALAERMWPIENFALLARRAAAKGWSIWVSGASADRPLAEAIRSDLGEAVRILTGTPLVLTACQLAFCDGFVGNDSGLTHLAAALGTPSVGIYRPNLPYYTAPINANVRTVGPVISALRNTRAAWPAVEEVEEQLAAVVKAYPRALRPLPIGPP